MYPISPQGGKIVQLGLWSSVYQKDTKVATILGRGGLFLSIIIIILNWIRKAILFFKGKSNSDRV